MSEPVVGDGNLPQYTREDFENAAEDARILMEESVIIPKLVAVDIIARRIFLHVYGALVQEINQGWEVEYPELVVQTLGMSAQEKATAEPATPTELQQQLFETVIPVLNVFIQMERDQQDGKTDAEDGAQAVPGSDDDDAAGVGELLRPTGGDEVDQGCEQGEGDRDEEEATGS